MGPNVGGVTPQNERLQDFLQRMVQLEPMQLMHVKQLLIFFFCERLSASMARSLHLRFSLCTTSDSHPGPGGSRAAASCHRQYHYSTDAPACETVVEQNANQARHVPETFGYREQEILGWQAYANALTAWAMHASLEFGSEIENACRWPDALTWSGLTTQQRARSRRLMAILRSAFESHAEQGKVFQMSEEWTH